jgi:stage III sporulation protein AG
LLVGIVLLLIPEKEETPTQATVIPAQEHHTLSVEAQLSELLSLIQGAGNVRVMLTVSLGEEILYQTNTRTSTNGSGADTASDTVTVTDAQRNEGGLIRQVNPPIYLGALIICQGADNPTVRLAITEAVARITGLGTDKISVVKMK